MEGQPYSFPLAALEQITGAQRLGCKCWFETTYRLHAFIQTDPESLPHQVFAMELRKHDWHEFYSISPGLYRFAAWWGGDRRTPRQGTQAQSEQAKPLADTERLTPGGRDEER